MRDQRNYFLYNELQLLVWNTTENSHMKPTYWLVEGLQDTFFRRQGKGLLSKAWILNFVSTTVLIYFFKKPMCLLFLKRCPKRAVLMKLQHRKHIRQFSNIFIEMFITIFVLLFLMDVLFSGQYICLWWQLFYLKWQVSLFNKWFGAYLAKIRKETTSSPVFEVW